MSAPTMKKARRLARENGVTRIGLDPANISIVLYDSKSLSGPHHYTVRCQRGRWTCECEGFNKYYKRHKLFDGDWNVRVFTCYHIEAAKMLMALED